MSSAETSEDQVFFGNAEMPTVQDIAKSMQNFGTPDYTVFVAMLALCGSIGIYFGFVKKSSTVDEYLVGGRNMKVLPVGMSLIASFISGISLLGIPTEIYVHGTSYLFISFGIVLVGWVLNYVYLPVFHDLRLTSTYEYLERRFDKTIRLLGSILFFINNMVWLPIVIYVPALAFNQVTGVNIHIVTPFVCVVCIFYTCVGGLKAVVWADFVQAFIMYGAMILIVVKGTMDLGGLSVVLRRNFESNRLELPNTDISPLTRHTIWSLLLGGFVHWIQAAGVNQNMVQRYLSLPTLKAVRRATWIFIVGALTILWLCSYAGLVIYAWYHECDPLTTKLAAAKDQLLPLLVMNVLGELPGLPGLFVAGVFSAALSSLSTGLNSMAAVVLEDFVKPFCNKPFGPKAADLLMKLTVVILGVVCVILVFVVEKSGSHVLQLSISLSSIATGPALGIFSMGILLPFVNAKGALAGGLMGVSFMGWLCVSAEAAISTGRMKFDTKPVSTEGCTYSFPQVENLVILFPPETIGDDPDSISEPFLLYRISYLWYTVVGSFVTVAVGCLVSLMFPDEERCEPDPVLFAPFVRNCLKSYKKDPDQFKANKFDVSLEIEAKEKKPDAT